MEMFGISGNANPAQTFDWTKVEYERDNSDIDRDEEFNDDKGDCFFPSTHEVSIYYQRIGTIENP